jgi:hypothetical protein
MKKCILILIPFAAYMNICAQTIQNDVVATGGGHATAGNFDMEFTIGEPVIETFDATTMMMTQGFLQPG